MHDLLTVASGDDQIVGHADWVEVQALRKSDGSVSREDLSGALRINGSADETARDLAGQAFNELDDRICSLSGKRPAVAQYPFKLIKDKQVLQYTGKKGKNSSPGMYLFLLGVSRHSMESTKRRHEGIDPTHVFERLCGDVLLEFWGGGSEHSNYARIGTARDGTTSVPFGDGVSSLCEQMCEGGTYKKEARSPGSGDGGLDVAVWRRFRDKRRGGLVGFAQCKTGINWRKDLQKMRPRGFCGTYMTDPLILDPVSIYMVPHRICGTRWDEDTRKSEAILFDRCRIVQYCTSVDRSALKQAERWLKAALAPAGIVL